MKLKGISSKTSEASFKRSWLYGGYQREEQIELVFEKFGLSYFIDALLNEIVPTEAFLGQDLVNISGFLNGELLFIGGNISDASSVEITLNSYFKELRPATKAIYAVKESRVGAFADQIQIRDIGKIFPFSPKIFRCSLQFYAPTWIASSLGMAPRINSSLIISADSESAFISAKTLSTKDKNSFIGTELEEYAMFFADSL